MFNDIRNTGCSEFDTLSMKMGGEDSKNVHMTGEIIDLIRYKDGRVEKRVGHNLVVNSFLNLVMSLLKQEEGYTGVQYWAVGTGEESWDDTLPTPEISDTALTSELGRVAIDKDNIKFLTPELEESPTPTNILQITHTFETTDCNGTWREFGIFGGNATASANSGIMINKRHHKVLTKTEEMTVERTMRFTLNLV